MAATRNSKQREAVLYDLRHRYDHPTAQEVYLSVKEKIPAISLATIYRNLNLLADEGEILRIEAGECDRFDGTCTEHCHFLCTECNRVFDVDPVKKIKTDRLLKDFDGEVKGYSLMFYGLCSECKN